MATIHTETLRAQVLNSDPLDRAARQLADADKISTRMEAGKPLRPRLEENGAALATIQREFALAVQARRAVPPSAEWLLDNYYIVEQQLYQARRDLSASFYYELPKLIQGSLAGYPRVYSIAVTLTQHTENRLNAEMLTRFVRAYQEVAPLSTGEVWALPIMLRLALIENLCELMTQAQAQMQIQNAANARARELLAAGSDPVRELPAALKRLERDLAVQDPAFLVQLVTRLRDQDPAMAPAMQWLERAMERQHTSLEEMIRSENHKRSQNRTRTGNVITSLRHLAALDWNEFFENVSLIERALTQDPSGMYAEMTFGTRDRYRKVVETIAKHDPQREVETARRAVELAARAPAPTLSPALAARQSHVGYFLVDEGLPELEAEMRFVPPFGERARRRLMENATAVYLGATALITLLLIALTVFYAAPAGVSIGTILLIAAVTVLPLSMLASGIMNWTLTVELKPSPPPKLELRDGIPDEYRTMIVIPALVVNKPGLEFLLEHLELRFLANREENLHFAVLGDFADAPLEHMPEDEELMQEAIVSVRALNAKYERKDAFYFFLRRRQWNAGENSWMGWERKRGKLEEFAMLLRGHETSYVVQEGDLSVLWGVKYLISLDADTELPLQAARRLVGTAAHPLNRAVLDAQSRIVLKGYGIIQPRVDVVSSASIRSRFATLFAGNTGLDPYSSVVSDVYQDLFRRGVYIGKALLDVDAMLGALHGRFPENLLLSHDLLEGGFLRVGFASDIELMEDFPSGYDTYAQRQHRWVRGDWQVTGWILPRVRNGAGQSEKNPLPFIERWKLLDNLRLSLLPPAVIVMLLAGWTILPGPPLGWTLLALLCVMSPFVRSALAALGVRPVGEPLTGYLLATAQEIWTSIRRGLVTIVFLLYQAVLHLDAIGRVFVRRAVTRRGLLEWTSHAVAERRQARNFGDYAARMWLASVIAVGIAMLLIAARPAALWIAAPLLLLWFLAPGLAYAMSQPVERESKPLTDTQQKHLRVTARRIWRFYQELAGPDDHWLPPDNYQIEPKEVVAHRTSPTNIGFLLLSTIAAYDFGYIGRVEFAERVERVLNTLELLEKQHGHFYNWYATDTLAPLHPRYISTVDSGNLAGCLIALKQACLEMIDETPPAERVWNGLTDTLAAFEAFLAPMQDPDVEPLRREVKRLRGETLPAKPVLTLAQVESRMLYLTRLTKRLDPTNAATPEIRAWCDTVMQQVHRAQEPFTGATAAQLAAMARRADALVEEMDFEFLYDAVRGVFAIGYNAENHRRDDSYYDLLASEARLTSFLTIARGEIPVKHWFRMGRPLTRVMSKATLLSWGGTMFEYLMPPLLLRDYQPSLLQQTQMAVIQEQIAYATRLKMPWGISESGFYAFDYQFNYQYRAFGVPELSLKRDYGETRVIAPYATFLALPYAPQAAWDNLVAMGGRGASGKYGYYEALDFTPEHLPGDKSVAIVRSYMAHHQGMSLVALDNYLHGNIMQDRFHREPMIAAAELLLQERVPAHAPVLNATRQERPVLRTIEPEQGPSVRRFTTPHTYIPHSHLLSNGTLSVMVTNAGGGYSAWSVGERENFVTRWRQDPTLDGLGMFCYIREVESNRVWSNVYQPTCVAAETYEAAFEGERVTFLRRDVDIETTTRIFVARDANAEIRRLTLRNTGAEPRTLELTTYGEVVLDAPRGDLAHPAFSKLFVESEYAESHNALLFRRRPREAGQPERWAAHFLVREQDTPQITEYETDRAKFVGRGRTLADPAAMYAPLSNTAGATLDPILSLRTHVHLLPNASVTLGFVTGVSDSREGILELCDRFLDERDLTRVENDAREAMQIELRHLGITTTEATMFQRFASRVLFADPQLRADANTIARNTKGQSALWAYGISGDYPIVLVRVGRGESANLVRQCLLAHEFWRRRNFRVDLVLVDEQATSYQGETSLALMHLLETSLSHPHMDKPGGVFLRRRDMIPSEDYVLLEAVARLILRSDIGELADQLNLSARHVPAIGARARRWKPTHSAPAPAAAPGFPFQNGLGGFGADGKEYVITLGDGEWTPAPWTNVLANPDFGCLVTEAGLGMSWVGNSQLNKLTRWSNDPVSDPPSEAVYVQDSETGEVWSPTPLPVRETGPYTIRHGMGYTVFERTAHALAQTLTVKVTPNDPVKIVRLKVKNLAERTRHLRATYYAEWVLGARRDEAQHMIVTERDAMTKAIFARNAFNEDFQAHVAFAAASAPLSGMTASRAEFLGRNGTYAMPAALAASGRPMSEPAGTELDPCAALQVQIDLAPGEETEIDWLLGQGEHRTQARALIQKYQDPETAAEVFATNTWDALLGTVQVKTPDAAMDVMLNRWLLYQALGCRIWGRAGFYQAGGAYGFRDQLQDVLALVFAAPEVARAQILRAAAHQFPEGDVQHWWHPPSNKGVRTRISDDYLWLPYVTEAYVRATGDTEIWDEHVPFVLLPQLEPHQEEIYGEPQVTSETVTVYEHCLRALEHGLQFGAHGLPLMGTGDWNDGMNRVGAEGKGESVWLGWFLYANLDAFTAVCESRQDEAHAARWRDAANTLKRALEANGWDGEWYRRAYFDDGTPLGSRENEECRIDAIAQAWATISGAASPERQAQALRAVEEHLVREQDSMILLLTPPFVNSKPNPGYIQGYVAGIRENGGQYTHGALWVMLANAMQGNGERAHELFEMLNPLNHARTREELERYKVEPYVIAADVYAHPQHVGRGGWTWYTGSAGWMYRIGIEYLLGLRKQGNTFTVEPCIPPSWKRYEMVYHFGTTRYEIVVENPNGVARGVRSMQLDGVALTEHRVGVKDDGGVHHVKVVMGKTKKAA